MTDRELRALVLEFLRRAREAQVETVRSWLMERGDTDGFSFSNNEAAQLGRVLWDLAIERVITWGGRTNTEARWPFFYVTDFGRQVLEETGPHLLDPDGYLDFVKSLVPTADSVVLQYAHEATRAFRVRLNFASAVMIGAAAERSILLLLEAIHDWQADAKKKARLAKLLAQPRLPQIFATVTETVSEVAKGDLMSYSVHQGSAEHLASFLEMIRVQRNDAVHPHAGMVDRDKVFLSLQSFPTGYQVTERLRTWFLGAPNPLVKRTADAAAYLQYR